MEFNIETKKIKVTKGESSFVLNVPSIKQMNAMQEKLNTIEPGQVIGCIVDYFAELGLPKEISEEMDSVTFMDLFRYIQGDKKK